MTGIVKLAHNLGLLAVSEGVETELQRSMLAEIGCDLAQGFLFAKPLTSEQLAGYLEEQSRR